MLFMVQNLGGIKVNKKNGLILSNIIFSFFNYLFRNFVSQSIKCTLIQCYWITRNSLRQSAITLD